MKSRNIVCALLTSILAAGWGAQIGNVRFASAGVSYSGAAASMPAMITTNATASQSTSDGKVKKSSMAYPLHR